MYRKKKKGDGIVRRQKEQHSITHPYDILIRYKSQILGCEYDLKNLLWLKLAIVGIESSYHL